MNVLITGGSRGIGSSLVTEFSARGDRVAFIYRSSDGAARALSEKTGAYCIKANISIPSDAISAVSEAEKALGNIDALVNNAGISEICLFNDITDEGWKKMIDTNLSGAFYVTREASKGMISKKFGRIINIGSMWGKTGASCEVHYSASKAGLRGLTMALAKELGPSGITVNCIEPGVIETEMNACLDAEALRALAEETPLCRLGRPEDVSALALFLASESAGFITGQVIGVDGGFAV